MPILGMLNAKAGFGPELPFAALGTKVVKGPRAAVRLARRECQLSALSALVVPFPHPPFVASRLLHRDFPEAAVRAAVQQQ